MDIAGIRKKLKKAREKRAEARPGPPEETEKAPDKNIGAEGGGGITGAAAPAGDAGLLDEAPAQAVAEGEAVDEEAAEASEFLTFKTGGQVYATRAGDIEEIIRYRKTTPVPRTDPFLIGITSFRGKVIPVVDIGRRLSAGAGGGFDPCRSKVVVFRGPKDSIGALVEGDMEVIMLKDEDISAPPASLEGREAHYIEGVAAAGGGFVSVVRMDWLLDFEAEGEGK